MDHTSIKLNVSNVHAFTNYNIGFILGQSIDDKNEQPGFGGLVGASIHPNMDITFVGNNLGKLAQSINLYLAPYLEHHNYHQLFFGSGDLLKFDPRWSFDGYI